MPESRRPSVTRPGALGILGMAFAVLLMHSVMLMHPGMAGASPSDSSVGRSAVGTVSHGSMSQGMHHPVPLATESEHPADVRAMIGELVDCGPHDHGCVFVRAGAPAILLVLAILFWWGFPPVSGHVGIRLPGLIRPGRPPPWAMLSHLRLQVIRC